ncbi:MAG: YdcF family protein [Clostridia bacterium]|nr:YdcF family protein [Clostridia bacterium]
MALPEPNLKFDTSNRKPRLFDALVLAVLTAAAVVTLTVTLKERRAIPCSVILAAFFLLLTARLLIALFGQIHYNPYSYNTIYYIGFALFSLSVAVTYVMLTVQLASLPPEAVGEMVLHRLLGSAKTYMLISAPFILVFSVGLCVSNVSLIRHEGFRFVNLLGILLSVLLVAGEAFLLTYDMYASGSRSEVMLHDLFANLFAAVYLYFECMLIGAIVSHVIVSRHEPEPDKDFIIILGCGIRKDGTPTPLLRGRCERALRFARKQEALTGKKAVFVTSGGQGPNEPVSESACMKRWLMEQGVEESRIIEEDRSADTAQNMRFSKEKIVAADPDGKVAFSTTNYHVFRGGLCARRVKMRAVGMGAGTKWYFWPNAAVREFVGLLTEHRGKQALIFGGLIAIYVGLTLLAYR